MKKTIFILAVLLLTTVNMEAQYKRRSQRAKLTQTERLDNRAEELTNVMVSTYKLNKDQQKSLLELNKRWLHSNMNRSGVRAGDKNNKMIPRNRCYEQDSLYIASPTLYREVRIQELRSQVDEYNNELKKIMSSSEFKAYQKRLSEGVAQLKKNN